MPIGQTAMPPDVNKQCLTRYLLQEKGMPAYLMTHRRDDKQRHAAG